MAASKTKSTKPKNGTKAKTASKTTRSRSTSAKTVAKAAPKQTRTKLLSDEVQGILLIALGLLSACTFYISAMGIVGEFVRNVCYGLFGAASSVFFVFFLLAGINCFRRKRARLTVQVVDYYRTYDMLRYALRPGFKGHLLC